MLLAEIADASADLRRTTSRLAKRARLAAVLRAAGAPAEAAVAVAYLSGELTQRRTGVGWASMADLPAPAEVPTLQLLEVDAAWEEISHLAGAGSQATRRTLLETLFSRATPEEQHLLRGLAMGELRQGALQALVIEAAAVAWEAPLAEVRRAVMLAGSASEVAGALQTGGAAALDLYRLEVGRGISPMLASTATDVGDALTRLGGTAAVEEKIDGIRIQVHRRGGDVRILSRSLDDITARLPEVVEQVLALPLETAVLDGEAVLLDAEGRPRAFQDTASRTSSRAGAATVTPLFFDALHLQGRDLLAEPAGDRAAALAVVVPAGLRVRRIETSDPQEAADFTADVLARGHEGVLVKGLDSLYDAGRRGAAWLKVKPVHTFDLLVIGAEWGSGRRQGWLSNLHLAALGRDGQPVMLGKTFKGMTDVMLAEQTAALQELAVERPPWGVVVRPELVVEIAIDGVQRSTRYPGGIALRFARVVRYRPDKRASEADALEALLALRRA